MAAITRLSVDGYGARRAGSFAGKVGTAASTTELDDSAGSGKYRERKRKQHENLPFSPEDYQRSFEKETTKEVAKAEVKVESTPALSPIDREIQGYLMDMGLIDPSRVQRIIEENERIDRMRRQNLAAIALLLLD